MSGKPTDPEGVADVAIPPERVKDPRELREAGIGLGRDPVRTPMAWDRSPHAGFSSIEPWLPLHVDWPVRNVEAEAANPSSMLNLYRALLHLRRSEPALSTGSIELVDAETDVLAYRRSHVEGQFLIALNFSGKPRSLALPAGRLLLSTIGLGEFDGMLRANEGIIVQLEG